MFKGDLSYGVALVGDDKALKACMWSLIQSNGFWIGYDHNKLLNK